MRRRWILLIGALVLMAAGVVLCLPRGPKEPVFEGKRLSYWISEARGRFYEANHVAEAEAVAKAQKGINAIGTNALPWLMSEFTRSESKWRASFNRWASTHPSVSFRFRGNQDRVIAAAFGLSFLGTNAVSALPVLAPYLRDENLAHWASIAIGGTGEMALPYLMPGLTSTNMIVRGASANGFGIVIHHSDDAIPAVIRMTQNSNVQVRGVALMALGNAKGRPELLIPVFKEALSSPDAQVSGVAAYAVGGMAEVTKAVMPELRRLLTNSDLRIVRAASNTLFRVDPTAVRPNPPKT